MNDVTVEDKEIEMVGVSRHFPNSNFKQEGIIKLTF